MGSGNQFFPWIHVDDVCRMVLFAIENEQVKGIVNGVAPEVVTYINFLYKYFCVMCYCYFSDCYSSLLCKKFC